MLLLALLIVGSFALYVMSPEERRKLLLKLKGAVELAVESTMQQRGRRGPFSEAIRARTPTLIVTPAIVAVNVLIFFGIVFGPATLSDPASLISWGANFGPKTTNGEWWRLVTAFFVHGSMLALLVNTAVIVQLGFVLERLLGPAAFAATYVSAGIFATLMSTSPEVVTFGAYGPAFGLYGLLLACAIRGVLQPSPLTIPLMAFRVLAPVAGVFVLYSLVSHGFDITSKAGLLAGFVFGMVVARGFRERTPQVERIGMATAATCVIAVIAAVPLRGMTDVRPELDLLVALEKQTTAAYEASVKRFRSGQMTGASLADVIDTTILPQLEAAEARVTAIKRVPAAYVPLVKAASDYLKLRDESWRLRARALDAVDTRLLREADRREAASLAALQRIRETREGKTTPGA